MRKIIEWEPGFTLEIVHIALLKSCLVQHDHNKTKTAEALGVSLRALRGWCRTMEQGLGLNRKKRAKRKVMKRISIDRDLYKD